MDFIKSYSSILSSKDGSQGDGEKGKKMQDTQSVTLSGAPSQRVQGKGASVQSSQQSQGRPKQQFQPQSSQIRQSSKQAAPGTGQIDLSQSNDIAVDGGAASGATGSGMSSNGAFNMRIEDAYYRFRKDVQGALEVGIQEALEIEKAAMFTRLNDQARKSEALEAEVTRLRAENDALHLQVSHKDESQTRMALLISELKEYRKDCLLGQRCLHRWNVVSRHGAHFNAYVSLLTAQRRRALARQVFWLWKDKYMHLVTEKVSEQAKREVKSLKEEREDFFAAERQKYEDQIEALKKELQGFAVKERKMKDAMKQAFLNGINAISEQATVALDRTDKMAMDKRLQEELERQYIASGGDPRTVQITSPPSEGLAGATQAAFAQEELALDEAYTETTGGSVQAQIHPSNPARQVTIHAPNAGNGFQRATFGGPFQTPTQGQGSYGGVPGVQDIPLPDNIGPIASVSRTSLPRPEPQIQRIPQATLQGIPQDQGNTLAARLRSSGKTQAKSGSSVYRESLRNINLVVQKE